MIYSKKANIFIVISLILTLLLAGFLGFNYYKDSQTVVVPSFINKSAGDVYKWCGSLDPKYACEYIYEKSHDYAENVVFYQSINENQNLDSKIEFKISSGLIPKVETIQINENTTKADIEKWRENNHILSISYVEEDSETVKAGNVIRIDPTDNIYEDTPILVYIAKGEVEPTNDTSEGDIKVNSGAYLSLTVSDFEAKVKALGLKPNHSSSRDAYSNSIKEGNIVWHGSGSYVNGETINYGLSKGVNTAETVTIKAGDYVGLSESDFIAKGKELTLKPNHNTSRDDYSDTIEKGKVVWHGSGVYVKDETFNYGLSLGKKGSESSDTDLRISNGQYNNLSAEEFESKTKAKTLVPYHDSSKDAYSDTIEKGKVVWHGWGDFEKNERIRYGLSLGKEGSSSSDEDLYVSKDKYVGKTESEFISIAQSLGLKPTHLSDRDKYSDSIPKGSIVTHGYGQYEKNENFNYGLSLGKQDSSDTTPTPTDDKITVNSYTGKAESDLTSFLASKGLNASKSEQYSSTYAKGLIISNDTGSFAAGSTIKYVVSKGTENITIMTADYYQNYQTDNFDGTKNNLSKGPFAGLSNVTYVGTTSTLGVGVIEKIEVNGNSSYATGTYPANTPVTVYIVSKQSN